MRTSSAQMRMVAASTLVYGASVAGAQQCQLGWLPEVDGPNAWVMSAVEYAGGIAVGGYFQSAGGVLLNHVGVWNGAAWTPLGSGVSGAGAGTNVRMLTVFEGHLIAGGTFTSAGGVAATGGIARWDGRAWSSMGSNPGLGALLVHDDALYGGYSVWTGTSWQTLGQGLSGGLVGALASFEGDLIAGGSFTHSGATPLWGIGRWDGVAWQPMGGGLGGFESPVFALAVWQGHLYAGGYMFLGPMARWNGSSWVSLAPTLQGVPIASVHALHATSTGLVVGGAFESAGSQILNSIARWNGSAWQPMAGGVAGVVYALVAHQGFEFVGGAFSAVGGFPSTNLARWGCPCYPDCNNDGRLTVADFGCFQTQFVKGDSYADCTHDSALTVADFGCFQTKFVAGCP